MQDFDQQFRAIYAQVMQNPNMVNYEVARKEVDGMMNYLMQILTLCVNGEDPATCEPKEEHDCGGNCSACSVNSPRCSGYSSGR